MMLQHELDLAGSKREVQVFATDVNDRAPGAGPGGHVFGKHRSRPPAGLSPDLLHVVRKRPFRHRQQRDAAGRDIRQAGPPHRPSFFATGPDHMPQPPDLSGGRGTGKVHRRLFHYALKPGGYLFLGNAESPAGPAVFFSASPTRNAAFTGRPKRSRLRGYPFHCPLRRPLRIEAETGARAPAVDHPLHPGGPPRGACARRSRHQPEP